MAHAIRLLKHGRAFWRLVRPRSTCRAAGRPAGIDKPGERGAAGVEDEEAVQRAIGDPVAESTAEGLGMKKAP
jgi:hypothetical protein